LCKGKQMEKKNKKQEKEEKLAQALRDNLRRRKSASVADKNSQYKEDSK